MSLVGVAEVQALVKTGASASDIQAVIDREEAEVIRLYGQHYDGEDVTETLGGGLGSLYLARPVGSVTSVTEKLTPTDAGSALTENTHYFVWAGQGRLERLPQGAKWGALVVVEYVPADDTDRRKAVIVELARLALERTAMQSENVAGEYSYTAPEWEAERAKLLRRLGYMKV